MPRAPGHHPLSKISPGDSWVWCCQFPAFTAHPQELTLIPGIDGKQRPPFPPPSSVLAPGAHSSLRPQLQNKGAHCFSEYVLSPSTCRVPGLLRAEYTVVTDIAICQALLSSFLIEPQFGGRGKNASHSNDEAMIAVNRLGSCPSTDPSGPPAGPRF